MGKNPPAMKEMWVRSLDQEDPLEKEMAIHFSILAWKTPWTEKSGGYDPGGRKRIEYNWVTKQQYMVCKEECLIFSPLYSMFEGNFPLSALEWRLWFTFYPYTESEGLWDPCFVNRSPNIWSTWGRSRTCFLNPIEALAADGQDLLIW